MQVKSGIRFLSKKSNSSDFQRQLTLNRLRRVSDIAIVNALKFARLKQRAKRTLYPCYKKKYLCQFPTITCEQVFNKMLKENFQIWCQMHSSIEDEDRITANFVQNQTYILGETEVCILQKKSHRVVEICLLQDFDLVYFPDNFREIC